MKVTVSHGKQKLSLDKALLTSKSTRYPVYVDPDWTGNPSQMNWARISDNGWDVYNSTSTTGSTNAREGWDNNSPGNGERARTYYQMNTSGIKGASIISADLYVSQLSAASCSDTPATVYGTDAPSGWNSSGLYWGHEPTTRTGQLDTASSHEAGTCPVTDGSGSYVSPPKLDFDVTSRITSAAAGNWGTATFKVESVNMNDATQWKQLAYKGGATLSVTYTYRPKLKDGTGDPAIHPSVADNGRTLTTTHTPTLSARAIDPDLDGGSEPVHILYHVYNSSGTEVGSGYGPASGYNTNGSDWTTPTLADGTYTWKATAQNSAGWWVSSSGTFTATQTFTVDTTAPHAPSITSTQFPPGQIGSAFDDSGTFALSNDHANNVKGYLFSLDGDLANTTYAANHGTAWTTTTTITAGKVYWATADNGSGTGTEVLNGSAAPVFAPGTTGPHRVFAKAVDQAGSTSPQTTYLFYAGTSTPTYAYGDKMVSGYTATNTDGTTTTVPAATTTSTGGHLISQPNYNGYYFADGNQGMLANNGSTSVAIGDKATFTFDIPHAGPWDIGANLTIAKDYGTYSLTLDAGQSNATTLIDNFDAYSSIVTTRYIDLGAPKDTSGTLQILTQGKHTLTLALVGKNASSTGYQAGIDTLRLGPAATCAINNTTTCLNNIATSTYPGTTTSTANADGEGASIEATDLAAAGWTKSVTVDGATATLPTYGTGTNDNMLASGQVVTVPATGVVNQGNAVVFLAFITNGGSVKDSMEASGTITYAPGSCVAFQDYSLDTIPDWITGPSTQAALTLSHQNHNNNTQTTSTPKVFALSVPLTCPGDTVTSISLPLWSNGVHTGQSGLHVLGLGIRPTSYVAGTGKAQSWTGTFAAKQDTNMGTWTNQTLRLPVHVSLGNSTDTDGKVRIRLSNALGTTPVTFPHVSIAPQDTATGGAAAAATPSPVTFAGNTSVTLPAGGDVVSDPVTLAVAEQSTLLVSIQLSGAVPRMPAHATAQTTSYATPSGSGDHTSDTAATNYTVTMTTQPYLTGIDVTSAQNTTGSVVLYGDQTVNADTATADGAHHLSDQIANALVTDPNGDGTLHYGILNEGTNSGSLTNNLLPPITNEPLPQNASNPLDRSALEQSNVRTILLSTGTSDLLSCIDTDSHTCATTVENELNALANEARSYYTDDATNYNLTLNNLEAKLTVYVATIPPFTTTHTTAQEDARKAVNSYILSGATDSDLYLGGNADGVIDFAAAVSDAGNDTSETVKSTDLSASGTPNDAYYQDLAQQYLTDTAPSGGHVRIQPNSIQIHPKGHPPLIRSWTHP
ncbi:hypothetical protein [Peterkaempfera sp. SMS 1(5)a]|uniref:hypothetical protein n=1 Tax=Peterkaempfera podocarpi TaxID=3232308 RepID=UPI00366D7615